MSKVRIGVIGVGQMGIHHARNLSQMEGVELVGVADLDEQRVKQTAKECKTTPYTDYRKLLDQRLDGVCIAVPTTMHKKVAMDAIGRGINVLIEKPIAESIESAEEIINKAEEKKVKLLVGHIERFNPAIVKLMDEVISKHLLGEIVAISAKRVGPYNPRIRDVGIIIDLGVHDIDIMRYIYNEEVRSVCTTAGRVNHTGEDHAIMLLRFNTKHSGVIETNWLTPHKIRELTVVGTKGIAKVDYINQSLHVYNTTWEKEIEVPKTEPLRLELEHFVSCIKNGTQPLITGKDGKYNLMVALAAIKSYQTAAIVEV